MAGDSFLWKSPRYFLIICAGIDFLGLVGFLSLLCVVRQLSLSGQSFWLALIVIAYFVLSWLFGTYSLLGWRKVRMVVLLRRQAITIFSLLVFVALCSWIFNPSETVWPVWRTSQFQWLVPQFFWSVVVRLVLRPGTLLIEEPHLLLVAPEKEAELVLAEWQLTPRRLKPLWITPSEALAYPNSAFLAISQTFQMQDRFQDWFAQLEKGDPRKIRLTTPFLMAEQQLERLPPSLMPEPWISYDSIPWNNSLGLQRQLKRVADVLVSTLLLLLASPIFFVVAILIWLDDRGPILYSQRRSGWLGQPFFVLKLRTMKVAPDDAPAVWTIPGDCRITRVGKWLRRSRIDELPQLINVLRGEMSLIGPRPERPELEHNLENLILHYRKRHWMRPGLSGWAQINSPYAASVDDSELKLSYDLYYLKNFSLWLDLSILFRTLKTVLKLTGR